MVYYSIFNYPKCLVSIAVPRSPEIASVSKKLSYEDQTETNSRKPTPQLEIDTNLVPVDFDQIRQLANRQEQGGLL